MESETKAEGRRNGIGAPPRGLALLMVLGPGLVSVSYTHLTLPTIYSV